MAKNNDYDTNSINTIGAGTIVKGDITSDGDFRIVGKLIGTIQSKGKVVIGKNGSVEGDIICKNADVSGHVKGSVKVDELLSLATTSKMEGDVVTSRIAIEAGAVFSGQCHMSNANETTKAKR
ncbi:MULTISPECIES: polymer-forming cytoskeletal protein [unclassified Lentimicrobium]|uniref:bactofilin family protein n=1 Tax=unclassified Lentimicrobium TaxID=2677434 RepID=UPI001551FAD5|nr:MULTISPECIES: polymer-forming cytoskeletal protein [unclassified Lentimicrobium]NPD46573.1 polymer-forming cytoskeletal protein [Lentimicrobium sp. S6]NPD85716.1 polymer-forming cytoskeletal protein [Lentimicrobium sp. L6]